MFGIKIIICIAIVCITSYIGIELASMLNKREKTLIDMITFLKLVQNDMKYLLSSIPYSFENARLGLNSSLKDAIGAIVVDMEKNGVDFIGNSISKNINDITELTSYDKEIFISTLKKLGKGDIDSQNNIILNAINILEGQIKEAKDKKEKNTKLYRTIGVVSGLIIVVIFI